MCIRDRVWTDQFGGRVVNTIVMLLAAAATWMLSYAYDYTTFLIAALGVGMAGGSFAVGIAYVSTWYPPGKQGTALGIFGAGIGSLLGDVPTAFDQVGGCVGGDPTDRTQNRFLAALRLLTWCLPCGPGLAVAGRAALGRVALAAGARARAAQMCIRDRSRDRLCRS